MTESQMIERILVIAFVSALMPLLTLAGIKEAIKHPHSNIIKLPKWILYIGLGGMLIAWLPALYLVINGNPSFSAMMFFLFGLLGAVLFTAYINRRIYLQDDGFIYKSFFGKKTKYLYNDVKKILHNDSEMTIIFEEKKISLENLYVTSDILAQRIPQERHDYTNNKTVQMGSNYLMISTMFFIVLMAAAIGLKFHPAIMVVLLVSLVFMIACRSFKIVYDKDTFTRRNIWGIKKTFYFSDISSIYETSEITVLKVKNRYILIESHAIGLQPFLKKAVISYRKKGSNNRQ